jgi:protein disulfide-isomerase A1
MPHKKTNRCGHCKKLNPILDEISEEAAGKGMKIGKVDATVEKKLSDSFDVEGFPTLKVNIPFPQVLPISL